MKRMTTAVQPDACGLCGRLVLTTSWDDRWGVQDAIVVDPTPLERDAELACVILGRPRYLLEATVVRTYRLGRITEYLDEQATFAPALRLPSHRCEARFPTTLPRDVLTDLGVLVPLKPGSTSDTPPWERVTPKETAA